MFDITIMCSNYNSDKYIDRYLKDVNRLQGNFHIIFVDANSTDTSLQKIIGFKFRTGIQKFVISLPNRVNVYNAWNLCVDYAYTNYVINLNTDDQLYPDSLVYYQSAIDENPDIDIFYSPIAVTDGIAHDFIVKTYDQPEYSHNLLLQRCLCGPFPCVRRQAIIDAGWFNENFSIAGDYEMWLRMSSLGYKFHRIPMVLGSYYENPEGLSTKENNRADVFSQVALIQDKYSS